MLTILGGGPACTPTLKSIVFVFWDCLSFIVFEWVFKWLGWKAQLTNLSIPVNDCHVTALCHVSDYHNRITYWICSLDGIQSVNSVKYAIMYWLEWSTYPIVQEDYFDIQSHTYLDSLCLIEGDYYTWKL